MQLSNGDDLGVSQQTLWLPRVRRTFCTDLYSFLVLTIYNKEKAEFMEVAGFLDVVGAIDGTHIRIVRLIRQLG